MNDGIFIQLQALLLESEPDYGAFQRDLRVTQRKLNALDRARSQPVLRLSMALQGFEDRRAGTADVAVLLRQIIRAYSRRLWIPVRLWRLLSGRDQETGLRRTDLDGGNTVQLMADTWRPNWLPDSQLPGVLSIDHLEVRRHEQPIAGDGLLYAMSEWTTYQSAAQQAAVHANLFAATGTTTLVTLPTGAGKSLCILLPAWTESRGGRIRGGTTLVVVPTVSLAIDQHEQTRTFFHRPAAPEYAPQVWTATTEPNIRDTIRRGIRNGTLPLLFLSPEALVNSELYTLCLDAARAGTLNRLVIDEAHLVGTWGAGFRTEFQFLSTYRRLLLEASGNNLRTLLLSATVPHHVEDLLERLFAEHDMFNIVRASRLRPEISYWFHLSNTSKQREQRVLEALHQLPRPAILYVTRPEDAKQWVHRLREEGFERIAAYSGKTAPDERLQLQREWREGRRDLMVATSAFGLGVDKQDVRTIIHACLPENVDRYYQEVGRAGRDGCSAISLVCACREDENIAFEMTSSARITSERALDRWQGMWWNSRSVAERGDLRLIDTNLTPRSDPDMHRSQLNQQWNEHVVLLFQRAGVIHITDTRGQNNPAQEHPEEPPSWIQIQIVQPHLVNDQDQLKVAIEETREREINQVKKALHEVRMLIQNNARASENRCLAYKLAKLYPDTGLACGGCPSCRRKGNQPYVEQTRLSLDIVQGTPTAAYLDGDLKRRMGSSQTLHLLWEAIADNASLYEGIIMLVGKGFQQIVIPKDMFNEAEWIERLVHDLGTYFKIPHRILVVNLEAEWDTQVLYPLPTVVVYPHEAAAADRMHCYLKMALSYPVPRINMTTRNLYLASEHGRLIDRIDGAVIDLARLLENNQTSAYELF